MTGHTATVNTLTAEVRVLMVGSRQVTMSVYYQLDFVGYEFIEPFGRVSPTHAQPEFTYVVGRARDGSLVRSYIQRRWPTDEEFSREAEPNMAFGRTGEFVWRSCSHILPVAWKECRAVAEQWSALPLIVLSGLR